MWQIEGMSKPLVSDALWSLIAPFLPPEQPKPRGGRTAQHFRSGGPHRHPLRLEEWYRADIHLAFLQLGCALISLGFLG